MKLRVLTVVLLVVFCMVSVEFITLGLADNPGAPAVGDSKQGADAVVPVGSSGSKDGFKSDLETPAIMSPLAQKSLLNGIAAAGKRVVAVGQRGHIIYSDDGGKTWTQVKDPTCIDLTAVYFPTPQKGWAVGQDGLVLFSSDGGTTWVKQLDGSGVCEIMKKYYEDRASSCSVDAKAAEKLKSDVEFIVDQGPVFPFLDVWFENESNGFVVGAFNLIFHTTDGGKNWVPWFDRTENPDGLHLYSIRPAGSDLFISGEQGLVLKLDRKAGRFVKLDTGYNGTFFGILGKSDSVVAFGLRGNIYRSADGGAKWQHVASGENEGVLGGTIMGDGRIVLVTQTGKVLVSKDNGASFSEIKRETGNGIPACSVTALGNDMLVIAGWMGVETQKIE